jgi:Glucose/sorbosone dehydrogenases
MSFQQVASGFSSPVAVTAAPGDPTTLYVVEQPGTIKIVKGGRVTGTFLDIRSRIKSGGEQGLLSVAFHPDYATNHRFYVDYTDLNGDTRVVEFKSANGVGLPGSARQLLFVDQPYENHNGGQLQFDKLGYLYVGMGDGGSGGDPENRAQNLKSRLGKLLRINPTRVGSAWQIVGYGLRNPWRYSFDRANGNLWIGDVGQNTWEEVDVRAAARVGKLANYGWSHYEGRAVYDPGKPYIHKGDAVSPQWVYSHADGCSITGGYVYRGASVPAAKALRLRRLLQRHAVELQGRRERQGVSANVVREDRESHVLRRGRQRRAVRGRRRRRAVRAPHLARTSSSHLRRLAAERRVGQRLQRLVERSELARQAHEVVVVVEPLVHPGQLVADPVEPLEQDVEATIREVSALHALNGRQRLQH